MKDPKTYFEYDGNVGYVRIAIVKDALMNCESAFKTGAAKFLVVVETTPFNQVETTM